MRLSAVKEGDIVGLDVRGHSGYAVVVGKQSGGLKVRPISPSFTWTSVKARQVTAHYSRRGSTRA